MIFLFFSLTSEFWSNDRPLVLLNQNKIYFPVLKNYSPSDFGLPDNQVTVDYKQLDPSWVLWPVIRWGPYESNKDVSSYPSPPSFENWMGTDNRGRDVLSRILYGFRYSMGFSFFVWLGAFFLGALLGILMGFKAGYFDIISCRVLEVFQSMPFTLVLISIVAVLGANLWILVLYSVLFGWMNISLYIRSEYLKLRKMEFVESARAYGASSFSLMFKHIFPNALTPLVTFSPFKLAQGIYTLVVLDYLGFGVPPPVPSWGELLLQGEQYFMTSWWLAFFPSLFMFLSLISLHFIGEAVRRAFDPKAV